MHMHDIDHDLQLILMSRNLLTFIIIYVEKLQLTLTFLFSILLNSFPPVHVHVHVLRKIKINL